MKTLLLIAAVFSWLTGDACECGYVGSFMKVAPNTAFIAVVKVVRYATFSNPGNSPRSVEVEVLEIIKGKERRKRLIVWGDDSRLCRPFVSEFKVDSAYVLALDKGSARWGQRGEKPSDYSISNCGVHWLSVSTTTGLVSGDVTGNKRANTTISLAQLKTDLTANRR